MTAYLKELNNEKKMKKENQLYNRWKQQNKNELIAYKKENFVSFPDSNTQRGFTIGQYDWNNKVLSVGQENLAKLERHMLFNIVF